jgi:hypothetical protein
MAAPLSSFGDRGHHEIATQRQGETERALCCCSLHRSPPLPLIARQAGERRLALSGTANSHAAKTGAIDIECYWLVKPDRIYVAEGGTAHDG